MGEVHLTGELLARGWTSAELARSVRAGEIVRPRRGAYVLDPPGQEAGPPDRLLQHRRLVEATVPQLRVGSAVSHTSAAVLHGLPVPYASLATVDLTRDPATTGRSRGAVHTVAAPLPDDHVTEIDGLPVTTLARTVVDVARHGRFDWGLAASDAALREGLEREELDEVLRSMRRWPGVRRARRVRVESDPAAESPAESIMRARIVEAGFPRPHLQLPVRDGDGRPVGYADFAWPDRGVVAEFDGWTKYGPLVPAGESAASVVVAEKVREDAFRALGWVVVRFVWADLWRPHGITGGLHRAFALARRQAHVAPSAITSPRL
ncbi:hypothetical protein [Auraticoccus monumenti]|uniref:Transcriptional regulator, AbiEi antitoxin, Type IV TA system n=1 Tax=Auraticoccus monumenti TaxID=675864 RepID=A0A1G6Y9R6_9ACTN|nr:hypothetical protein [Auraticoccus monumenti]SDD87169.1 Transcriptional regulator, AbiEi antitoxin, Type IV TA system [Auraticoccus monumenti]